MNKKYSIFIVPQINKYCGIYSWIKNVSKFSNKSDIYSFQTTYKTFYTYKKFLFTYINSDSNLFINYTPYYWGPFYKQFLILLLLSITRIFKPKIKICLVIHDYIRPNVYSLKGLILVPYLYFLLKFFIFLSNKIFIMGKPVGLISKFLNNNKKVTPIKALSMIDKPTSYIKGYTIKEINLLIFGSLQAHRNTEIKLIENYLSNLSKSHKVNLYLLGSARELKINFKKANCTLIRISHLDDETEISDFLRKSSLALFFHSRGVTLRSSVLAAAIQHGVPIIGIAGINTEEILKNLYGIFLYDYFSIKSSIKDSLALIEDKKEYLKCSSFLQKYYRSNYNWKNLRKILSI